MRYETENGRLNNARVVYGSVCSQDKTVGYIDDSTSWVEMTVWVPKAGNNTIRLAKGNGYAQADYIEVA